jgi:hypothetical protein
MNWQSFSKLLHLLKIFDYKGCNEYNNYMLMADISIKKLLRLRHIYLVLPVTANTYF